jgi:transglutaminase-like putative cysteine protease
MSTTRSGRHRGAAPSPAAQGGTRRDAATRDAATRDAFAARDAFARNAGGGAAATASARDATATPAARSATPPNATEKGPSAAVAAPRGRIRTTALAGAAVLLAVAAELPLLRVFGSPGLRLVLLAALPACLVTAGVRACGNRVPGTGRAARSVPPAMLAGLIAGALPGLLTAAPDPFSPASLTARLREALTDGWYRLLSVPVPVPYTRSFTDLPVLLAAVLATVITLCALSRHPAVAVLPAVAGFAGLLVLGVDGPVTGTALAGGFALAVLTFLVAAAPPARGGGRSRAVTGAVSGGALIAAAVLVTSALHPAAPYNPRASVHLPVDIQVSQDPLAVLPALLQTPSVPVLTARLSGALLKDPRNWLLLTYDTYDGAGWEAPGDARPAVTAGPVPSAVGTGTATVTAAGAVTLLPHPANVLDSSPGDLDYAPDQEILAAPSPVRQYTVRVSVGVPSAAALSSAALPTGVPSTLTSVPSCVPSALKTLAKDVLAAASVPGEQVERLQAYFTSAPFRYDRTAAPGEGCASINNMLTARKGTSSQYATAFALAARLLGIPARVAVGYSPGTISGDSTRVTDGDAYAWAQVELTGIGWMDVDPTPKSTAKGQNPVREKQPAITQLKTTPQQSSHPGKPVISAAAPVPPGLSTTAKVAVGLGGLLAVLLAWLAAVWLYGRARRSRRRRASDPAARVLGAWDETLLAVRQAGVRTAGQSAPSVASRTAEVVPAVALPMRDLSALAERALYDSVTDADSRAAWQLSDQVRTPVLAAAGRGKRIRRLLVPVSSTEFRR